MFWLASLPLLREVTSEEVLQSSRIMMESAAGVRKYTAEQITPLLREEMKETFHPQAVAAYAAKRNFDVLHAKFSEYRYREAALNPTNPEDRAVDWEADIINDFRAHPEKIEISAERNTPMGPMLDLARPLTNKASCLECHSTADAAPKSMIALYGTQNGFGWRPNDIIGAQIVSVPMSVPIARAERVRAMFVLPFLGVFVLLFLLLNLLLDRMILAPIDRMAKMADAVSLGDAGVPEYIRPGNDQIARLSVSFNRMRRSLQEALRLLDDH
ncbi:MAG: c-type heme family protein [Janthinobacterium lividum]